MSEEIEIPPEEKNEIETALPKKKKELSQRQIEHLNTIRVKALEKKREIKLKKHEEYKNKVTKPEVIEEPIKEEIKQEKKPEIKAVEQKKKKVIKKVIKYVEEDSDDDNDDDEIVVKKKPEKKIEQQPQPIEKSYNELLYESSLERMQNKIMNERAKQLIQHIIPNYYYNATSQFSLNTFCLAV